MGDKNDAVPPQYAPAPGMDNMGYQPPPPSVNMGQQPPYMMQQPPQGAYMMQPQGQYMAQQPTTIIMQQPVSAPRPDDCMAFSIITCLFCNWFCLGTIALICACQSKSAADEQNTEVARSRGLHARNLSISAVVLTFVPGIIAIIVYFTAFAYAGAILSNVVDQVQTENCKNYPYSC